MQNQTTIICKIAAWMKLMALMDFANLVWNFLIQVSFTCIHFHYSMHTWAHLRPTNYFDVLLPTPRISIICVERRLNTKQGDCPKMARPWSIGFVLGYSMTGFEGNEHLLQIFQQMRIAQFCNLTEDLSCHSVETWAPEHCSTASLRSLTLFSKPYWFSDK